MGGAPVGSAEGASSEGATTAGAPATDAPVPMPQPEPESKMVKKEVPYAFGVVLKVTSENPAAEEPAIGVNKAKCTCRRTICICKP